MKIEKDPSYVLTLTIPFFESEPEISAVHNLPVPDFDETGFIGRKKDVEDIKKLILSNKVVSIIGDGGVGKTAVALKVAYDILDLGEKCPFELIIWTSAKTTMLTAKGIEDIHASIKNYGSLIDAISVSMDEKGKLEDTSQKLNEILDYLLVFKTLLIIDNLETIQSEEVRNFIREAQMRCNIVITSRIGLGELEFPRKLSGLTEVESANLIREIARIRNSDTLLKLPQATLVDIASKLYFNPLALKWFVNTVETGISPNEVLSNKNNLLNFCLSNVYEKLSKGALRILDTIRGARKSLNTAEIIYLSGMQPIEVRKHLNELFTTTLISREIVGKSNLEEVSYSITDFSSDYLSKNHILPVNSVKEISAKLRSLTQSVEHISQVTLHNEFSLNALSYRTPNERIAAKFLTEALSFSKNTEFVEALKKIDEAKSIVPNYFETYRVSAFIKATAGDYLGADEDYRTGLEIEPANLRLLFYYSQFLLFQIEDINTAFDYAQKVYLLRPNNSFTAFLIARCLNAHHKYDEAIEIIENLLKGYVNPKDTRIAHTDMIRYLQNKAIHKIRIENDFTGAFDCFKKSIEIFEICFKAKNYDYKVIRDFAMRCIYIYHRSLF
ncbi:MAG: hypothetical protein IPK96_05145 [Flammeovirgaceae bacterium]|nr:hypothetical protein [Flammeovirgaceae bacterium]